MPLSDAGVPRKTSFGLLIPVHSMNAIDVHVQQHVIALLFDFGHLESSVTAIQAL